MRLLRLLYLVELGSNEGSLTYFWRGGGGFGAARRRGSVTDLIFRSVFTERLGSPFMGEEREKEREPPIWAIYSSTAAARYPPSKRSALLNSLVCMHCQLFVRTLDSLRGAVVSSVYVCAWWFHRARGFDLCVWSPGICMSSCLFVDVGVLGCRVERSWLADGLGKGQGRVYFGKSHLLVLGGASSADDIGSQPRRFENEFQV